MCDKRELNRMYKVTDMMISAHSKLRDKYRSLNLMYGSIVIIISLISIIFVFASDIILNTNILGCPVRVIIIIFSILSFLMSILEMKMGWQGKEIAHSEAIKNYFSLKCKITDMKNNMNEVSYKNVRCEYEQMCKYNIPLPDEQFLKLKRYHCMKILISRYLSRYKGAFIWLVRLKIIIKDNVKCIRAKCLT